jgi:aminoglycoside phosphotransferase family enzyme
MKTVLDQDLAAKVQFLASNGVLVPGETPVARETHMSWVFLTRAFVFKLKKPVRQPYLDFSTCAMREAACREELRINQRLSAGVYLRLARITRIAGDGFELDGTGSVEDWLVVMRRLDDRLMLDKRLAEGASLSSAIEKLADVLASFYLSAPSDFLIPEAYVERFRKQFRLDRSVIAQSHFRIDHARAKAILDLLDQRLEAFEPLLRERVASGCIIEGHGDLRLSMSGLATLSASSIAWNSIATCVWSTRSTSSHSSAWNVRLSERIGLDRSLSDRRRRSCRAQPQRT